MAPLESLVVPCSDIIPRRMLVRLFPGRLCPRLLRLVKPGLVVSSTARMGRLVGIGLEFGVGELNSEIVCLVFVSFRPPLSQKL